VRRRGLRRQEWGSCALVGNSGSLLRRKYGSTIDKHDQVFRINQAPVVGHERAVGSRTTHRVLNNVRPPTPRVPCVGGG
jgi:hypothetical protein